MMKLKKNWRQTGALACLLLLIVAGWTSANTFLLQQKAPEDLLLANSFLYCKVDGSNGHQEAYKQTAEYKAFYESGLAEIFSNFINTAISQDETGNAEKVKSAVDDLLANGFVLGAAVPEGARLPAPIATLIFPNAGRWQANLFELIEQSGEDVEIKNIEGRKVASFFVPDSPEVEIGIWAEGKHLVLTAGINSVTTTIACAQGDSPSIAKNEKWSLAKSKKVEFEQTSFAWLDWKSLQKTYGDLPIPIPQETAQPVTVRTVLELLGIDKLDQVISRAGYQGEAIWAETSFVGLERKNGSTMTLKDLPPLPKKMNWFTAFQHDSSACYDLLIQSAKNVAKIAGPDAEQQLGGMLGQLPDILGFDPQADLFAHFGKTVCLYEDANGGFFGAGTTLCISLKDPIAVQKFIDTQIERLEKMEEAGEEIDIPVYPFRVEKNGGSLVVFDVYGDGINGMAVQYGAVQVLGDWLVIGVMPQSVEAFYLRTQGKLASWKPDEEHQTAFKNLPQEFTSISVMNPRETFQLILNIFTPFLPMIQAAALEAGLVGEDDDLPFYVEDFPPSELITAPLFPNVVVGTGDKQGIKYTSRASTYGAPMFGGNRAMTAVAVGGMGTALLLPAVQQARTAARRANSKNNMKQIGLAMHNYHDIYRHFPRGTVEVDKLKPEERLSWAYSILPFLDQVRLYESIEGKGKWDSKANAKGTAINVPAYLNPGSKNMIKAAKIDYAGMCGVGKNAPLLKTGDKNAGVFGYNRKTRIRDITDGTSNTIMVTEVNKNVGPWAQGGKSTLRSLTKKPYVNGPDGIGGPEKNVVQVLFADGSVRSISKDIDPKTFEALVTIGGNEVVGEF